MRMTILKSTLVVFFANVNLLSCSDTSGSRIENNAAKTVANAKSKSPACLQLTSPTQSWQGGVATIFQTKCGSCHTGAGLKDYATYAGVTAGISNELVRIDAGTMPSSGPLSTSEKDTIHAWVTAGMPETDAQIPISSPSSASAGACPAPADSSTATNLPSSSPSPVASLPSLKPVPGTTTSGSSCSGAGVNSWQGGISTIFTSYCGSCHPGSQLTDYKTYLGVKGNIAVELLRIDGNTMPPGAALAQADKDAIHAWQTAGMPETDAQMPATSCATTPAGPAAPPALLPTYSGGVKTLMAAYCTSCHSAAGRTSPYLDTLAGVKNNYDNVMSTVKSGSMPRGGAKLSTSDTSVLTKWGTAPNTPYGQWAP